MVYSLENLLYLMSRLRDPVSGCPWDIEQDFSSITTSTLEECYELVDAIQQNDVVHIREELGDVLFQVVFYCQMAKEKGWFEFADVASGITEKLVRRHPHVFPDGDLFGYLPSGIDVKSVLEQWEAIKQKERSQQDKNSLLDDIPRALPALKRAGKIQKRVSRVGFDWPDAQAALAKIREEIDELEHAILQADVSPNQSRNNSHIEEEMGDILFSCVNVARLLQVDAEQALTRTNDKFIDRFHYIEAALAEQGKTPDLASYAEMDALWEQSKTKLIKK